jgi:hypothetical protein
VAIRPTLGFVKHSPLLLQDLEGVEDRILEYRQLTRES